MSLICTVSFNQEHFLFFVLSVQGTREGVKYFLPSAKTLFHVIDTNGEKLELIAAFILHMPPRKKRISINSLN